MEIKKIQEAIKNLNGDAWLFCDFHNREKIAFKILNLDDKKFSTRRWFYIIPKEGEAIKIVHKIESEKLDSLPGIKMTYSGYMELNQVLEKCLKNINKLFMQYSPLNNIPTVSMVDAGTYELIKQYCKEILSSANLIQIFDAHIDEEGFKSHEAASKKVHRILDDAFLMIGKYIKNNEILSEFEVQKFLLDNFKAENLVTDGHNPIVAINEHAANPHFDLNIENSKNFKKGDRVLIDLWARENYENAIYFDITWCGYIGNNPTRKYVEIFNIVKDARKLAKNFIVENLNKGNKIYGWQVDDIARNHIKQHNYGEYFLHRTGHSIHTSVHGNGVNLDNLETKDDRYILNGSCFSIEPGIYFNDIGVRSEINICILNNGEVKVFGKEQEELVII